jgi:20S proteasome alpha/beta subunit
VANISVQATNTVIVRLRLMTTAATPFDRTVSKTTILEITMRSCRRQLVYTIIQWSLLAIFLQYTEARSRSSDGRYSYSLSTFDSSGRLAQVEFALLAANQGVPIIALATDTDIFMVAPEAIPSPFMIQDGTARFVRVTDEIILAHSGLSADGRVLAAAAQRLAVEHEYTFDENIPIEIFLQEMSLLIQEYTIKAAARPFGTSLLIGYNPRRILAKERITKPILYRIDPSGTITKGQAIVINEVLERSDLLKSAEAILDLPSSEVEAAITRALESSLSSLDMKKTTNTNDVQEIRVIESILSASLSTNGIFRITKHWAA